MSATAQQIETAKAFATFADVPPALQSFFGDAATFAAAKNPTPATANSVFAPAPAQPQSYAEFKALGLSIKGTGNGCRTVGNYQCKLTILQGTGVESSKGKKFGSDTKIVTIEITAGDFQGKYISLSDKLRIELEKHLEAHQTLTFNFDVTEFSSWEATKGRFH